MGTTASTKRAMAGATRTRKISAITTTMQVTRHASKSDTSARILTGDTDTRKTSTTTKTTTVQTFISNIASNVVATTIASAISKTATKTSTKTSASSTTDVKTTIDKSCCIYLNIATHGDMIPASNVDSYGKCCDLCACMPECKVFAYKKEEQTCEFGKSLDPRKVFPSFGAVSGAVIEGTCPASYQNYIPTHEQLEPELCQVESQQQKDEISTNTEEKMTNLSIEGKSILLGLSSESCERACFSKGLKCDMTIIKQLNEHEIQKLFDSYLNQDDLEHAAWREELSAIKYCPFYAGPKTVYCSQIDKVELLCSASPGSDERRLCSCQPFESEFKLSKPDRSDSCDDTCASIGKTCRFDRIYTLKSEQILSEIARLSDTQTDSINPMKEEVKAEKRKTCPYIMITNSSVYCYESGSFNPSCSAKIDATTRVLCECADVELDKYNGLCDFDDNNCLNGGKCMLTNHDKVCLCNPGYLGNQCEAAQDACGMGNLCHYYSKCINHHSHYSCECQYGRSGKYCQTKLNFCDPNPCQNLDDFCYDLVDSFKCLPNTMVETLAVQLSSSGMMNIKSEGDLKDLLAVAATRLDLASLNAHIKAFAPFALEGEISEHMADIGFQLTDIMRSCYLNERVCQNWKRTYNPQYLNCYSLNHNVTDQYFLERAGRKYGLQMLLNMQPDQYMKSSESQGLKVSIHGVGTEAQPDIDGLYILPGYETNFILKHAGIRSLPSPYPSQCIRHKGEVSPFYYSGKYTVEDCVRSRNQDEIISQCNCVSPTYPTPPNNTLTSCRLIPENLNCINNINHSLATGHCLVPCEQEQFSVQSTKIPLLLHKGCNSVIDAFKCDYIKNLGRVNVFYSMMNSERVTEQPKYSFVSLLSTLGGFTGLLTGASVITLVEFVYLIMFGLLSICKG